MGQKETGKNKTSFVQKRLLLKTLFLDHPEMLS